MRSAADQRGHGARRRSLFRTAGVWLNSSAMSWKRRLRPGARGSTPKLSRARVNGRGMPTQIQTSAAGSRRPLGAIAAGGWRVGAQVSSLAADGAPLVAIETQRAPSISHRRSSDHGRARWRRGGSEWTQDPHAARQYRIVGCTSRPAEVRRRDRLDDDAAPGRYSGCRRAVRSCCVHRLTACWSCLTSSRRRKSAVHSAPRRPCFCGAPEWGTGGMR